METQGLGKKILLTKMAPTPAALLPDELIPEILSFLPVSSLVRFRCACKSWKTLISDPSFVKLHLKNSQTRNSLFTMITLFTHTDLRHRRVASTSSEYDYSVVPYSLDRLIENPPFTLSVDPYYHLRDKGCSRIVDTCNGLILLLGHSERIQYFRLWNPATRTISPIFGHLSGRDKFTFCCDDSTGTYKIVASGLSGRQRIVKILSLGHNVWREIQSCQFVPLPLDNDGLSFAVCLCSTVNWLAIKGGTGSNLTVEQFVFVSLDLGTETYNQYRLPSGFDEVPHMPPLASVLGGFLCFSYLYKKTDFVIWQMKEFGVEDSWTQFLKISYQILQIDYYQNFQIDYDNFSDGEYSDDETRDHFQMVPLLLSEDADTLVLKNNQEPHPILYNWRDNRAERTKITTSCTVTGITTRHSICWHLAKVYVESLVSTF